MGCEVEVICKECGTKYKAAMGGGFLFHLLHCDKCGEGKGVSFQDLDEIHLKYIKGLNVPYCVATGASDKYIQDNYPEKPIGEDEYHRLVEEFAGKCKCGGNFTFKALPRCPKCGSKEAESVTVTYLYD